MKKLLIVSPYFAPSNAADIHRIRMSLPYFKQFGWEAEVITVAEKYSEMQKDNLLQQSIPTDIKIHQVQAFNKKWTSKFGLGSLALRSLWFYHKKVNSLLKQGHYDLIYFSTTAFPICILGAFWKKRFDIPYVIDMQDPWHSEYYRDKQKDQQPPKYWFSYRLNKYLEPKAMRHVDGLISVSENYIVDLKTRYPEIKNIPAATITFGAFATDFTVARNNQQLFESLLDPKFINIVYIGRGGNDMHTAVTPLFKAFKEGLSNDPQSFNRLRIYFIGTSYAPNGQGKATIQPLAKQFGIDNYIIEITDRISYYHTIYTLQQADALFVPGSDDPKYSASKIYPYLLTNKPLMAIFNKSSSIVEVINQCTGNVTMITFPADNTAQEKIIYKTLFNWSNRIFTPSVLMDEFKKYSAESLTKLQTDLFIKALNYFERANTNP